MLIPVTHPTVILTTLSSTPFPDWIRAASIVRSMPDPVLDSLQFRNCTGEFAFWSAQDPGHVSFLRLPGNEVMPDTEVVDTIMVVSKTFSQQTRHLRDRPESEPGERGAGIYLPEELLGYTIAGL